MRNQKESFGFVLVSETYSADLKGRQSVRTTFKLPPRCIDALSLLAAQLGIKQKSIFDHLIDDARVLQALAREIVQYQSTGENRVAKTYVVSRKTLENLEQASKQYQTPRDALVEFSIERIMPLLQEEKTKHQNRKKLHDSLEQFLEKGRALLKEADQLLDRDDPAFERIYQMVATVGSGCDAIEEIIEKGRRLEEF